MKPRQSSIELLRILAMLMIVSGHFLGQSGLAAVHPSFGMLLASSGARWACNLFLIVGCWFMVDAEFSLKRVGKLYLTVITYTVPLTILALVCGGHPGMKDVMRGFLPFTGRALWFASAYISLMLLTPWLRRVFELPMRSLGLLVGLLTVLLSGVCTLPDEQMCYAIDCCWFVYVYLAVGWAKRALFEQNCGLWTRRWFKWVCLAAGLAIYVGLVFLRGHAGGFVATWSGQCLSDFKTLPNFLSAVLVFAFFIRCDIGSIGWINRLAKPAFAVYVIHQTPAFFPFLWERICCVAAWQDSPWWWAMAIGVVLVVYCAGLALESLRVRMWNGLNTCKRMVFSALRIERGCDFG